MRKMLAVAAMTALVAVASPALAAPTITFAAPMADGSTSATFSDTGIATGNFIDTISFGLPAGLVSSTISSIFTTDQSNDINFSNVALNGVPYSIVSTGQVEFRTLLADPVTSGFQNLVVMGTSGGNGSYSGTISFAPFVAAVPEPASWLTMILGMGLVGFAMRRVIRRSDEKFTAKMRNVDGAFA